MITSDHRWLCSVVREIAAQLHTSYDKYGIANITQGNIAHVGISSSVLMAALRLGNAVDIVEGNFVARAANDNRKGVA